MQPDPIRIRERRHDATCCERCVTPHQAPAPFEDRGRAERRDRGRQCHETRVQIGPQSRQRNQQPHRPARLPPVPAQHPQRDRQQQQGKHVRPRQVVNPRGARRQQAGRQRHEEVDAPRQHVPEQHGERGRDRHARQQHHALEPGRAVGQSEQDVGEPLPGAPRRARPGEREQVRMRHPPVVQNVLARPDVPAGIAVRQQRLPAAAGHEQPHDQRREEPIGL